MYPTHLSTSNRFIIAQISDLHLSKHEAGSFERFLAVLHLAKNQNPNLLLLTGDLVNDGDSDGYDWLFQTLTQTGIPFLCLAGNHDVTREIGHHLPFDKRQFLPRPKDGHLIDAHRLLIELPKANWQLLAVNSALNGHIKGHLPQSAGQFIKHKLQHAMPTLIALHHHPLAVNSAWIDAHMLDNHKEFWQLIGDYQAHIVCGHVHQAHTLYHQQSILYTCPAVSRQFTPHQDQFCIDTRQAGYRLITLEDHELSSEIIRLC